MHLNRLASILQYAKYIKLRDVRCLHSDVTPADAGKLFTSILGIDQTRAKEFVASLKLKQVQPRRLSDTLNFCKSKFEVEDILETPKLFNVCRHCTWEQYYRYLQEAGFRDITISDLVNFGKINAMTIKELKQLKKLPEDANVALNYMSYLSKAPDFNVSDLDDDNLTLMDLQRSFLKRFLMYRLEASEEDVEKILRIHKTLNKSIEFINENITLALEIGFEKKKIINNAYVLEGPPRVIKEVLATMPTFLGLDMKTAFRRYPKLMGIQKNEFDETYKILKDEGISDETIRKCMNIFTLSIDTIQSRLEEIKSTPETRILMTHPNMLGLIVHYHRTRSRLSFLQQIKLKCASMVVLGIQANYFENHLKGGKDVTYRTEVFRIVKTMLNTNDDSIETDLKKHPYYIYVPYVDLEDTYLYLKRNLFKDKQIAAAVQILLYPKNNIGEVLQKIKCDKYIKKRKPRISKVGTLHMALYFLEKEHRFTGNGIWRKTNDDSL